MHEPENKYFHTSPPGGHSLSVSFLYTMILKYPTDCAQGCTLLICLGKFWGNLFPFLNSSFIIFSRTTILAKLSIYLVGHLVPSPHKHVGMLFLSRRIRRPRSVEPKPPDS